MYIYLFIYIHTHTHPHTHTRIYMSEGLVLLNIAVIKSIIIINLPEII